MTATSRNTRSARSVMSSRLPMGVATTNSVPAIERSGRVLSTEPTSAMRVEAKAGVIYCTIGGSQSSRRRHLCHAAETMIASEPLPHFVDDLLGYLHETHPTYATLDGVHAYDDHLEDLSRHAIESEVHALTGYLRRLDEISQEALTPVERLEHRMLTDHLQSRVFELEVVRTWERSSQFYSDILASS